MFMDVYGTLGLGLYTLTCWVGRLFMSHGCCWVVLDR
jgi:hypothetical protein